MSRIAHRPHAAATARPNPGPRVAPPQPTTALPWATVLEQPFPDGRCTWVMAEGALVPVPLTDQPARPHRTGLLFRRRLRASMIRL